MISIQTYTPKALSTYIKSFWYLKVSGDLKGPYVEEILPDGHHEVVFHLTAPAIRKRKDEDSWQKDPATFFAGQNKKSYIQQFDPGAIIYGVRFRPHTQSLLYDFPATILTDNLVSLEDINPHDNLATCLDESPETTFGNLEKEFAKRIARLEKPGDTFLYVDAAVNTILQQKGQVKMKDLEKITGVTGRHLEKSFQKFVGLSPKHFSNIIKYNHFVNYKKNNPGKTLTECAYEAAFYDQSHLIYLSNLITGQSPKSYFGKLNYINNYFLEP